MRRLGGDAKKINPLVPVDLVIDHSIQVDFFGSRDSMERNVAIEFDRNRERYEFLRWGQTAFGNFRVVPPSVGIVHQVNLEFLAKVVFLGKDEAGPVAFPDTLVGTDSHTTMINGLGVLGWGVGGIEAEAVMLGQPLYMLAPEVIGLNSAASCRRRTTATDLVLTVTQMLRKEGVVNKFVEFFGPGVSGMKLADRATIANMAPEYGATMGFFPVDERNARLSASHRPHRRRSAARRTLHEGAAALFRTDDGRCRNSPRCSRSICHGRAELAGPKRPQDRVPLNDVKQSFRQVAAAPMAERGFALSKGEPARPPWSTTAIQRTIGHGAVVIAAITSCTNTSNPVGNARPPDCWRRRPSSTG